MQDSETKIELAQKLRDLSREFDQRSLDAEAHFERFCEESGIPKGCVHCKKKHSKELDELFFLSFFL